MIREEKPPFKNGLPPIHPGEFLVDDLEAMKMSAAEFDAALAVPAGTTALLLDGCIDITPELALRLSRYFGTSAEIWMSLQSTHDIKVVERKHGPAIFKQVTPRIAEGSNPQSDIGSGRVAD